MLLKTEAAVENRKPIKPGILVLFTLIGAALWIVAALRIHYLLWVRQWGILSVGRYAYHIGVVVVLIGFGAACMSGPCLVLFRAVRRWWRTHEK